MENTVILGIETSCDETSAAVVADGRTIMSNVIASQIPVHQKYGGVVPEIASRKHVELITSVIAEALDEAGTTFQDIHAVAVTYGPGLVGALLVGVSAAKALAYTLNLPLIGVNHIESHIYANFLARPELEFPLVCLVVSGGHTDLVYLAGHGEFELMGRTRDDAAGEAFDKVARALGLGYPGGPLIDKLAVAGNPQAIDFPRVYLEGDSLDFSFSGLKSSALNFLNKAAMKGLEINKADLAASFQQAVVDVLVDKAVACAERYKVKTILVAGGVAANSRLRQQLTDTAGKKGINIAFPPPVLCTDNAAMVGCAGYFKYVRGETAPLTLNAVASLKLGVDRY
ncbi:MAG: tRNA (adenosine(37)-N6)-threonylcarbamoyltransferase complex transferase subunit TsaD [Thermincola sp.]|nr:tRNA (adenosine(37)-N6)-threonylcarbamoyltransferase complex transferase subunit TsaD [Thermincola sp.]MDT3704547.1 tRNA (adenosine(37)-N6)-threonylcarbamoyltransferase complex transferase subunit TsaD [Thermincola sp.]